MRLKYYIVVGHVHRQPNDAVGAFETYWKINGSFEAATRTKASYVSPAWTGSDHEVAVKYKYSENAACGVNTNFIGEVTLGTWFKIKCNGTAHCV